MPDSHGDPSHNVSGAHRNRHVKKASKAAHKNQQRKGFLELDLCSSSSTSSSSLNHLYNRNQVKYTVLISLIYKVIAEDP